MDKFLLSDPEAFFREPVRLPKQEIERARSLARELNEARDLEVVKPENTTAIVLSDREALPKPN